MADPAAAEARGGIDKEFLIEKGGSLVAALVFLFMLTLYLVAVDDDGQLVLRELKAERLLMAGQSMLCAGTFLVRRPARLLSTKPLEWLVAFAGSFATFLWDHDASTLEAAQPALAVVSGVAVAVATAGIFSLGRSFGFVAANRGIKSGGMYRLVRHPIYAAYMITVLSNLATGLSPWNVGLVLAFIGLNVTRIFFEERILMQDPAYRDYATTVRYRLLPGVF